MRNPRRCSSIVLFFRTGFAVCEHRIAPEPLVINFAKMSSIEPVSEQLKETIEVANKVEDILEEKITQKVEEKMEIQTTEIKETATPATKSPLLAGPPLKVQVWVRDEHFWSFFHQYTLLGEYEQDIHLEGYPTFREAFKNCNEFYTHMNLQPRNHVMQVQFRKGEKVFSPIRVQMTELMQPDGSVLRYANQL